MLKERGCRSQCPGFNRKEGLRAVGCKRLCSFRVRPFACDKKVPRMSCLIKSWRHMDSDVLKGQTQMGPQQKHRSARALQACSERQSLGSENVVFLFWRGDYGFQGRPRRRQPDCLTCTNMVCVVVGECCHSFSRKKKLPESCAQALMLANWMHRGVADSFRESNKG